MRGLLLVLATLLAGCATDPAGACGDGEVAFEGDRYAFCAPAAWEQAEAYPTDVVFLSEDTGDGFRENLNMVREPTDVSLREYVDAVRAGLDSVMDDVVWLNDQASGVGNKDGWIFEYTARQGQSDLHFRQYVTVHAGHGHVLTYTAEPATFPAYEAEAERAADSLTFK